jgi:phage terminase large subunit
MEIELDFPEKLGFLFEPKRYKILYGGRGSAKSWSVARALIAMSIQNPIRILCARELQNSISDSVIALLADQIKAMGVADLFDVQRTAIYGVNGSEFSFVGLKHNVTSIKSFEGVDICWVEEGQAVSKTSWETLIPTIRKPNSEIWVTFNPDLDTDETYKRFVVTPPNNAVVAKVNHSDNPWFPDVLKDELEQLKARDVDSYLNVWEGHTRQMLDGAVYAHELRKAQEEDRIRDLIVDKTIPVQTFWDLGWADMTSIWFVQVIAGGEVRVVDFYQNRQKTIHHYAQVLQDKGYVYSNWWLPHDSKHKDLTGKSINEILVGMGKPVRNTPMISVESGINAARLLLDRAFIHSTNCADGLQNLRHYRYDVDANTKMFSNKPLHDQHSHAADAWRYVAVALDEGVSSWGKSINQMPKWIV